MVNVTVDPSAFLNIIDVPLAPFNDALPIIVAVADVEIPLESLYIVSPGSGKVFTPL